MNIYELPVKIDDENIYDNPKWDIASFSGKENFDRDIPTTTTKPHKKGFQKKVFVSFVVISIVVVAAISTLSVLIYNITGKIDQLKWISLQTDTKLKKLNASLQHVQGVVPTSKLIPTTITTTPTTSTTPATTTPVKPISCVLCRGPKFICERAYRKATCTQPDHQFCINDIENLTDGSRYVTRRCATEAECLKSWIVQSADRNECKTYSVKELQDTHFTCSFCCKGNNCNLKTVPPNLYSLSTPTPVPSTAKTTLTTIPTTTLKTPTTQDSAGKLNFDEEMERLY